MIKKLEKYDDSPWKVKTSTLEIELLHEKMQEVIEVVNKLTREKKNEKTRTRNSKG